MMDLLGASALHAEKVLSLSPEQTLDRLAVVWRTLFSNGLRPPTQFYEPGFIDVRSEAEFHDHSIPGFLNKPILLNEERAEIGSIYKKSGRDAAITRGLELVSGATQEKRILDWQEAGAGRKTYTFSCFRGGLRSKYASRWISDRSRTDLGITVRQVEGGAKALRKKLLECLTSAQVPLLAVSGPTGSGKSKLLRKLALHASVEKSVAFEVLDLEAIAEHKGSSFGRILDVTQPSQATFENRLALAFWGTSSLYLVEDESQSIGSVWLPKIFKEKLRHAPMVRVQESLESRFQEIFSEYVSEPLLAGVERERLLEHYLQALARIGKKLGGKLSQTLEAAIQIAFAYTSDSDPDADLHRDWIIPLLTEYYDKLYAYSASRNARELLFEGTRKECEEWIRTRFGSLKP